MEKCGYAKILHFFEEAPLRQKIKVLALGISRKDKAWQNYFFYRYARIFLLPFIKMLFKIFELITYKNEKNKENNSFITMTQDFVYKKIL